MQLGKILKEIDLKIAGSMGKKREGLLEAENIIRKHLSSENAAEIKRSSRDNDGWIPVNSHGLPSSSEHDFRFWVTVQYKNGFRRTLKATWNYYNNHFVYQNGKIISEDVVAYRYYSAPKPYQPERSEGE